MSAYIDSIILFIMCAALYPAKQPGVQALSAILLFLSLYCFALITNHTRLRLGLGMSSMALCLIFPDLCTFLPFQCYVFFYCGQYQMPALYGIPAILYLFGQKNPATLLIFPLAALSCYLAAGTKSRERLCKTIHTLRDNSTESQMQLKRRNRILLENQDNQIYIAILKERNRIAREIHDNVGHLLSRSILQTGAILSVCRDERIRPHLALLKETLDTAMDNVRSSTHDLRDESIDLSAAISSLAEHFTFCPLCVHCEISGQVPREVKYCFLAITKEALNNIMRHSNATKASVTVKEFPAFFQLLIEDNGDTASKNKPPDANPEGIGLANMRERTDTLNGILTISCEQGFRIFVSVPKT